MANIFNESYAHNLEQLANDFSKIKIPVYVIACGAQAPSYDYIEQLVDSIGKPSKKFISSIYATGGQFCLRGNFTKEFFERLGFHDAVVTGCPSIYQNGKDFRIDSKKVTENELLSTFNGNLDDYLQLFEHFKSSVFIDQDRYFPYLNDPEFHFDTSFFGCFKIYKNLGRTKISLFSNDQVKLFPNMNDWHLFFNNSKFNYSFGSRIHGSIMPILSGIQATVVAIDTRTQEMADFYDIPYLIHKPGYKYTTSDIYQSYFEANYDKFNRTYIEKFSKFENFLIDNHIVTKINNNNKFLSNSNGILFNNTIALNTIKFEQINEKVNKFMTIYDLGLNFISLLQH